jgi:hypothetical protein
MGKSDKTLASDLTDRAAMVLDAQWRRWNPRVLAAPLFHVTVGR